MTEQQLQEKKILSQKYRSKGFQTLSLAEYEALKARKQVKKIFKLPVFVKFIFSTPLLIIFIFGLLFLPYIIYLIATGHYVGWTTKKEKTDYSYADLYVKKDDSVPSSANK